MYEYYNSVFFKDYNAEKLLADNEKTKDGIIKKISWLLYHSTDKETVLEGIKKMWIDKIPTDYSTRIKFFYKILGVEQPKELKDFKREKIVRTYSGKHNSID